MSAHNQLFLGLCFWLFLFGNQFVVAQTVLIKNDSTLDLFVNHAGKSWQEGVFVLKVVCWFSCRLWVFSSRKKRVVLVFKIFVLKRLGSLFANILLKNENTDLSLLNNIKEDQAQ